VPHFTLGVLVWLLLHRMPGAAFTRSLAALGLFGTVVWFAGSVPGSRASLDCAAVTACTLVLLHPLDGRLAAFRPLHWLGWAGTISYSLYLVHVPIVSKTRNLGFAIFSPSGSGAGWVPLAACVAALTFAAVFYRLVEAPLERLRRRILNPSPPQA
jgi:peptidoglycan/LPS O-acetylase OafA/YrhL